MAFLFFARLPKQENIMEDERNQWEKYDKCVSIKIIGIQCREYLYVVGLTLIFRGTLQDSNLFAKVTLFPKRQ